MRLPVRLALAASLATGLAGCGDPALWTRWRAERHRWTAEREIRRIELNPSLATASDYTRAAAGLERVMRLAPLERWIAPDAPGDRDRAREVAAISARAMVRRAELDLMRGWTREGLAGLERAIERTSALPVVERDAMRSLAAALDQLGRGDEGLAWWRRLATSFEPYDVATREPAAPVLEAARVASRQLALRGETAASESLLATVEGRLTAALAAPGAPPRERAWRALGVLRTLRGDATGALEALRSALPAAARGEQAAPLVLDLSRAALAAGWPDSALAYAAWAEEFGGEPRRHAMRLTALAWEAAGAPDSAIASWTRLLEAYPKAQDSATESRFRRGFLLELLGRWERARSEYRALAAAHPSHPLAFDGQLRIVQHHVRQSEAGLARLEAERLVELMDYLIATQHDESVQRAARRTRGEALLAAGEHARAFEALSDVWRRWPASPSGIEAAWKAADIAAGPLGNRAASDTLLSQIASGSPDPEARARALERLRRRGE